MQLRVSRKEIFPVENDATDSALMLCRCFVTVDVSRQGILAGVAALTLVAWEHSRKKALQPMRVSGHPVVLYLAGGAGSAHLGLT